MKKRKIIIILLLLTQYIIVQGQNESIEINQSDFISDSNHSNNIKSYNYNHIYNANSLRLFNDSSSQIVIPHSQKSLTYTNGNLGESAEYYSIVLYRLKIGINKEQTRFALIKETPDDWYGSGDWLFNNEKDIKILTLPDEISAYDMVIFEDTLYFCGKLPDPEIPITTNNSNIHPGYLAWISLKDLFEGANNIKAVNMCYNFTKVKVFKDINDGNKKKVALMGRVCLKKEPIWSGDIILQDPFNGNISAKIRDITDIDLKFYDCLYLYNPLGSSYVIRCKNDTLYEKFQDIHIIGDTICLVGLRYNEHHNNNIYTGNNDLISNKVYYRTIKPSDLTQTSSYFDIEWCTDEGIPYDLGTAKGVYNIRMNYSGFKPSITNWNNSNNSIIGAAFDDDFTSIYYATYPAWRNDHPLDDDYTYDLLLSFNHYEYRENQTNPNYYATILNQMSSNELIYWSNYVYSYLGCAMSARIFEDTIEHKLIDVNHCPPGVLGNYRRDFTVITEGNKTDIITEISLDDFPSPEHNYFFKQYDMSVYGNRPMNMITINGYLFHDGEHFHINDLNMINDNIRGYTFRAVGSTEFNTLGFYQYPIGYQGNNYQNGWYRVDHKTYELKTYPVWRNHIDEEGILKIIKNNPNQFYINPTYEFDILHTGAFDDYESLNN